jgi:hypothetical protein
MIMDLNEICTNILDVEKGLLYGEIQFEYDNLACAMKYDHPGWQLDDILAEIFFEARAGRVPERKSVENVLKGLKRFKRAYKVKELSKPIKDLTQYLAETETN